MFEITEAQRVTLHNVRALRGEHVEIAPTATIGDVLRVHLDHTAVDIRPNGECVPTPYGKQYDRCGDVVREIARPFDALALAVMCPECETLHEVDGHGNFTTHSMAYDGQLCSN